MYIEGKSTMGVEKKTQNGENTMREHIRKKEGQALNSHTSCPIFERISYSHISLRLKKKSLQYWTFATQKI